MFVSNNWCKQYMVGGTVCIPDVELLCLNMTSFYLLREFGKMMICAVYIPPSRDAVRAAAHIADCVRHQLQRTPGAPVFILG